MSPAGPYAISNIPGSRSRKPNVSLPFSPSCYIRFCPLSPCYLSAGFIHCLCVLHAIDPFSFVLFCLLHALRSFNDLFWLESCCVIGSSVQNVLMLAHLRRFHRRVARSCPSYCAPGSSSKLIQTFVFLFLTADMHPIYHSPTRTTMVHLVASPMHPTSLLTQYTLTPKLKYQLSNYFDTRRSGVDLPSSRVPVAGMYTLMIVIR